MKLHRPKTYWRMVKRKAGTDFPEPKVMRVLKKLRGQTFVDVGANIGIYSIPLAQHFRQVYSFEPNPEANKTLSMKSPQNVLTYDCAITDKDGEARFYLDPLFPQPNPATGSANTVLEEWHYKPASSPKVELFYKGKESSLVRTRSLDSFFESYLHGLRWIDLLKVDVEGAEFLVLEGAKQLLAGARITHAMVELHDRDRKEELVKLFNGYQYKGHWVDADHYYAYWKGL